MIIYCSISIKINLQIIKQHLTAKHDKIIVLSIIDLRNTIGHWYPQRYSMVVHVINGICTVLWFWFVTIQSNIETNKCTVDFYNGTERYWMGYSMILNGIPFFDFVLFKSTTETNTFNVDLFNDTERYWMVCNGIEWYSLPLGDFYKILYYSKYHWDPLNTIDITNGTGW